LFKVDAKIVELSVYLYASVVVTLIMLIGMQHWLSKSEP